MLSAGRVAAGWDPGGACAGKAAGGVAIGGTWGASAITGDPVGSGMAAEAPTLAAATPRLLRSTGAWEAGVSMPVGAETGALSAGYGALRVRVSVPYQNSVLSLAARGCMRMMRGVTDSTISSFSTSV